MPPKTNPRDLPEVERDVDSDSVAPDAIENIPATDGYMPAEDGGNPQHPIHDEDEDDLKPEDYERQIDNSGGIV